MIELIVAFVAGILVAALFNCARALDWELVNSPFMPPLPPQPRNRKPLETPLEITNAVRDAYHEGFLDGKLWADSSRALKKE